MKTKEEQKKESQLVKEVLLAVKAKEYLVKNYLERQEENQYLLSYKDGKKHFIADVMANFTNQSKWIDINKDWPLCFETGDWEGKKSDKLLFIDSKGDRFIGECYQGDDYTDIYDEKGYIRDNVTHYQTLPENP